TSARVPGRDVRPTDQPGSGKLESRAITSPQLRPSWSSGERATPRSTLLILELFAPVASQRTMPVVSSGCTFATAGGAVPDAARAAPPAATGELDDVGKNRINSE